MNIEDIELSHTGAQDHLVKEDKVVYLVRDDSGTCENPCTEGSGMGLVGTCHRREDNTRYHECQAGKHPLHVYLDIYDHSGRVYAVHNSVQARNFPDQRWVVAHCGGVWVPDSEALNHIHLKACEKMGFKVEVLQTACCAQKPEDCKPWKLAVRRTVSDKLTLLDVKRQRYFSDWKKAAAYAQWHAKKDQGAGALHSAEHEAAIECAEQCLETYNAWCSGDIWGVICDTVKDGKVVDTDSCWGFIGHKHALACREDYI